MQRLLLTVDKISTFFGQVFSWLIVGLTILITWEVYSRYVLNKPHAWALDAQIMLYGTLFMMAGAYTLAKNNHVRGDVLYGFFQPRTQAWVDLILYIAFFLPGIISLDLGGLGLCPRFVRDPRADLFGRTVADLSVQVRDSARGRATADAGRRRDHSLHPVHP